MLSILFKNNQLIVCNKPPGLAVQPDKTSDQSLLKMAESYCKHPLHLVNRLDRPVSGAVLFAKKTSSMTTLTEQFRQREVGKIYLAIVQNLPEQSTGVLRHYILKNERQNRVQCLAEPAPNADLATLEYRVLGSSERYHLLHIQLITGKHHQIRAQLSAIGCPVRGDVKYGFKRNNPDHSIQLHAWRLGFNDPVSNARIEVEAPLPDAAVWAAFAQTIQNI
jgi:23S rRNA pseudouridine1911/1915/1917 synthase